MSERETRLDEVRAGVFVLVALALLGAGTLWIAGFSPKAATETDFEVAMTGSAGVRPGDRVRVSGIEVGRVRSVELAADEAWPVLFQVSVDSRVEIRRGASARLTSDGMLGAPYLEILAGPVGAEPLPPGSRIHGTESAGLDQSLAKLSGVADQVGALLEQASATLEEIGPLVAGFQAVLSEENVAAISETLAVLGPTIDSTGSRVGSLMDRLESLSGRLEDGISGLPELTAETEGLVGDLRAALGDDGSRLAGALDALDAALSSAEGALATVGENGDRVDAMLVDLRAAAANLRALSEDLKRRPSRLLRSPRAPDRKPGDGVDE